MNRNLYKSTGLYREEVWYANREYRLGPHRASGPGISTSSGESPNHDGVRIQGAQGGNQLEDMEIPGKYTYVLEGMPRGATYNVGQMYY